MAPLLVPDADDLRAGLRSFADHEELGAFGAFDAVLAVAARRAGASALVSADRGFAVVEEPVILDPAADGFTERLEQLR